ncbi:MAG: T9SS type A sorting domain-containing protein [Lentimicrobiaceae bacterium]|nr:T9SS type A sorting domain-containing protein [Lentimicrobiaceae bacterium]
MKKLLFLVVSMVLVWGVNAQTARTMKSVPGEGQAIPAPQEKAVSAAVQEVAEAPSYFNQTMLGNVPAFKKSQKSGNYVYWGQLESTRYAASMRGAGNIWWGADNTSTFNLFPDSLAVSFLQRIGDEDGNRSMLPAIGFTLDPYSRAYDANFRLGLFEDEETGEICPYRIDTIGIGADYRIANYNAGSPDTLRIFVTVHNAYNAPDLQTDPLRNEEYYNLRFTSGDYEGVQFVVPMANYEDPYDIPEKGSPVTPGGLVATIDYILSPDDSAAANLGYIYYRPITIPVESYNIEVPAGSVACMVMKFIPGYEYDKDDTIRYEVYNTNTQQWISDDLRQNTFAACVLADSKFENFLDWGGGRNSRLAESKDVRYRMENIYDHLDPDKYAYAYNYYAIPLVWYSVSVDDECWYPHPAEPEIVTVSLPDGQRSEPYSEFVVATGQRPLTWSLEGNTVLPAGLTLNASTGEIAGTFDSAVDLDKPYSFVIKVENHLDFDTKEFSITVSSTNVTEPMQAKVKVYPNPANDRVRIDLLNNGTAELSIVNTLGQVVKVVELNEMNNTIDISSLDAGIYVLKVSQGGSVSTTKLTKK